MLPYNDTIAAIATPYFSGGIGVIRISGPDAFALADKVFRGKKRPSRVRSHSALYGTLYDSAGDEHLDEALCLVMSGPHTYTGEDVVELSMHGSPLLLQKALDIITGFGARQAEPGEFTYRAYINGRLDLTQAEAVQHLVGARSEAGLRNAFLQLQGSLRKKILSLRGRLEEIRANLEAEIEFPDEGLNFLSNEDAQRRLRELEAETAALLGSYRIGRKIEEGLKIVICGPPNSGKSTLLNRLLNEERAIVHSLPGTTRDIVEGTLQVKGATIRLIDTAGIRTSGDEVEEEGVRRTHDAVEKSDLAIWVQSVDDGGDGDSVFDMIRSRIDKNGGGIIRLVNKSDTLDAERRNELRKKLTKDGSILISARRGWGLGAVRSGIERCLETLQTAGFEGAVITSSRQNELLRTAHRTLKNAVIALEKDTPFEYISVDINECADSLDELTGDVPRDNIYDIIFRNFCIGK